MTTGISGSFLTQNSLLVNENKFLDSLTEVSSTFGTKDDLQLVVEDFAREEVHADPDVVSDEDEDDDDDMVSFEEEPMECEESFPDIEEDMGLIVNVIKSDKLDKEGVLRLKIKFILLSSVTIVGTLDPKADERKNYLMLVKQVSDYDPEFILKVSMCIIIIIIFKQYFIF